MYQAAGSRPALTIALDKIIPSGAGLGGGSADGAAVLEGLNRMLGEPLTFHELLGLASELGSDVPFALSGVDLALAWERGRRLLPLAPPPPRPVLVLVPQLSIGAAEAYGWLAADRAEGRESLEEGADMLPPAGGLATWDRIRELARNDLEGPVFRRYPALRAARDALRADGADPALRCGSGAGLAGGFEEDKDLRGAVEALAERTRMRTIRTWAGVRG